MLYRGAREEIRKEFFFANSSNQLGKFPNRKSPCNNRKKVELVHTHTHRLQSIDRFNFIQFMKVNPIVVDTRKKCRLSRPKFKIDFNSIACTTYMCAVAMISFA